MLEGKELILATREFATEDVGRSRWVVLSTLAVIGLGYAIILSPLPLAVRLVGCVLTGLTLVRLFVICHDFQHKAIFGKSKLARWFFSFFGVLILVPPQYLESITQLSPQTQFQAVYFKHWVLSDCNERTFPTGYR